MTVEIVIPASLMWVPLHISHPLPAGSRILYGLSISTNGLAKGMTVFHGDIRNQEDLVEALRAGAFTPVENYHIGKTSLYGDLVEDVMPFLQTLDSYDTGPDQSKT